MLKTTTTTAAASRYETFVMRLWVEDARIEHGEIRHVRSNTAVRFRDIAHACEFMMHIVSARGSGGRAPEP